MGKGLTKAQRELLERIASRGTTCAGFYPPARKLVELGLAQWVIGTFGDHLSITPKGRLALKDAGQ